MTEPVAPRVAPLPREQWGDDEYDALRAAFPGDVFDRFVSTGPDSLAVPNAIATMLHHPAVASRWLSFNNVLLGSATIDPRLRELMVLRVAWRTRSNYEWAQHVRLSSRYAITPAEIDAVANGERADSFSPLEAALLAATDQLLDGYRVDTDTWTVLAQHLDARQLVEIVFVVGTYTCLAMVFKSLGVELDAGLDGSGTTLPEATS